MIQESVFIKALSELKELAREQQNVLSNEQVQEFVTKLSLSEEQTALIHGYLKDNHIGIGQPVTPEDYYTQEDFDYLNTYLEELGQLPIVTKGQKEATIMSAMAGDAEAKSRLIEIYLPQVVDIAKLYAGQGVSMMDLIGEGNVSLAMGVEMLGCLEKTEEADGMLGKMIMDAMEQFIEEEVGEHKKDERVLKLINKVEKASEELAETLQRKVTVDELVTETGLKKSQVLEAIRISANNMEYIEVTE